MLIDLTRPIDSEMPVYPGDDPVSLKQIKTVERDHYTAFYLQTGLHAGTHVDAPMHLMAGGKDIGKMPLDRFFAEGIVLSDWQHIPDNEVPEGAAVLIDMGMEDAYGTHAYYTDHPEISNQLCDYLISRKVSLVGVNAPSPDYPPFPIHKRMLMAEIPILENLTNLKQLAGKRFTLIALPLPMHAEGSPVRAAAWINENEL